MACHRCHGPSENTIRARGQEGGKMKEGDRDGGRREKEGTLCLLILNHVLITYLGKK